MNIYFDNGRVEAHSNADKATTSKSNSHVKETQEWGAFALDISGTVMDNTAYEGQGKTAEDVMQDAGQVDVATQKNYLAVMSNTMSGEDFAKLQEEGYHPGNTDIETVVTIVDEIKAALVKGGKNIEGYTDDLDAETLARITGSAGFANELVRQFEKFDIPVTGENVDSVLNACERAAKAGELSDGAIKYMLRNHMEPTLDNMYKARHSATADADRQGRGYYQDEAGYYARKAEDYNWRQLTPQMEKIIENAGLAVTEETLNDARWLVEKGIELTEMSLTALYELKNLEMPETPEGIIEAAAAAIAGGKSAGNASLTDVRSDLEKARGYVEEFGSITDEAADKTVSEGKTLNLRNLRAAQLQIGLNVDVEAYTVSLSGRRQLEEVRLRMSVQANLTLIRSGFSIDTAELSALVEALEAAEQQRQQLLFRTDNAETGAYRAGLYEETLSKVREIPYMPAALAGRLAGIAETKAPVSLTLETVYQEGSLLKSACEKAGETYEALMTAPRADLGDSIRKAFRNVDELLKEMNVEASEGNRRAVRILGYNRMEISEENINAVKATDIMLRRVTDKMTPASTLEMIREGVNPLSISMEELETYLNEREREPVRDFEKYSEFLYKLEKNNGIAENEREAYIGIYRLFRQLEKTDGAAIGTLLNQGAEVTAGNLLSAMRSNKKHGMDAKIDDTFGGIAVSGKTKSISEQIESGYQTGYYTRLASDIFDGLDGGRLPDGVLNGSLTLEEMAAMLPDAGAGDEENAADKEYRRQQLDGLRNAKSAEDTAIRELIRFDQPVTADHLLAAGLLHKERGRYVGRIRELAAGQGAEEELAEAVGSLQESMTDDVSANEAYERLERTCTDILEEAAYGPQTKGTIDIREINNLYKQISLAGSLAKEESYEVPVNIDGELTSINLTIVHGGEESGRVTAAMETAAYGKVEAQFRLEARPLQEYRLNGYVVCDKREGLEFMGGSGEELKNALEQTDITVGNLNYIYNQETEFTAPPQRTDGGRRRISPDAELKEVPTKKLYETAKIFIGYIQKGEGFKI